MFLSYIRQYGFFLAIASMIIFMGTTPAQSEPIEGFRDLKFGMTKQEVNALEACSSSSECLYELAGKNRYLHPLYKPGTSAAPSPNPNGDSPVKLARITIDMGAFTDEWYGELQIILRDKYSLTRDLTEEDMNAFTSERTSELVSEYENGKVLLKVVRRKFGNLVLKVIYQNDIDGCGIKETTQFETITIEGLRSLGIRL